MKNNNIEERDEKEERPNKRIRHENNSNNSPIKLSDVIKYFNYFFDFF